MMWTALPPATMSPLTTMSSARASEPLESRSTDSYLRIKVSLSRSRIDTLSTDTKSSYPPSGRFASMSDIGREWLIYDVGGARSSVSLFFSQKTLPPYAWRLYINLSSIHMCLLIIYIARSMAAVL